MFDKNTTRQGGGFICRSVPPCVPVGEAHENCVFIWCMRTNNGTLVYPVGSALTKIKTDHKGRFNFWQGHLCNSRIDFICELLQFGKDVKVFLEKAS